MPDRGLCRCETCEEIQRPLEHRAIKTSEADPAWGWDAPTPIDPVHGFQQSATTLPVQELVTIWARDGRTAGTRDRIRKRLELGQQLVVNAPQLGAGAYRRIHVGRSDRTARNWSWTERWLPSGRAVATHRQEPPGWQEPSLRVALRSPRCCFCTCRGEARAQLTARTVGKTVTKSP